MVHAHVADFIFLIVFLGEFDIGLTYVSKNGTGTGELDIEIRTVDGIPVGKILKSELLTEYQ